MLVVCVYKPFGELIITYNQNHSFNLCAFVCMCVCVHVCACVCVCVCMCVCMCACDKHETWTYWRKIAQCYVRGAQLPLATMQVFPVCLTEWEGEKFFATSLIVNCYCMSWGHTHPPTPHTCSAHACAHTHMHTHAHTHTHTRTRARTCTPTCTRTHTHTHRAAVFVPYV